MKPANLHLKIEPELLDAIRLCASEQGHRNMTRVMLDAFAYCYPVYWEAYLAARKQHKTKEIQK